MTVVNDPLDLYDTLEEDVRQIMIAEVNAIEPARLVADKNIWRGPVRPANDNAQNHEGVWVMLSGGRSSMPFQGAGGTEFRPTLNVRFRSGMENGAYTVIAKLARRCFLATDQFPPPAFAFDGVTPIIPAFTPLTNICDMRARSSHPLYLGMDNDGHHELSFTLECVVFGP